MFHSKWENGFFITMIMALFCLMPLGGFAKGKDVNEIGSKKIKVADLVITKYHDGRIKGIENPGKLSKEQKKEVLKLMKFSDEEIDEFPEEFQNTLIQSGGVNVGLETETEHIYTDLNGTDHVITESNIEEINKIKQSDFDTIYKNNKTNKNRVTPRSTVLKRIDNGIFHGKGSLLYKGLSSTGKEYVYEYTTRFYWDQRPALYFTDVVGHAWQSHTTLIETETTDYWVSRYSTSGSWLGDVDYGFTVDKSSVYGTKDEVDISYLAGKHYGILTDQVRIPVTNKGTTGQFASAYGHSWSGYPLSIGITIGIAGISFDSDPGD